MTFVKLHFIQTSSDPENVWKKSRYNAEDCERKISLKISSFFSAFHSWMQIFFHTYKLSWRHSFNHSHMLWKWNIFSQASALSAKFIFLFFSPLRQKNRYHILTLSDNIESISLYNIKMRWRNEKIFNCLFWLVRDNGLLKGNMKIENDLKSIKFSSRPFS